MPGFGDPRARVLIVGLAPAAHGGNRTGRVFTGDRSGDFLFASLFRCGFANQPTSVGVDDGLVLRDAYVAAAVRCAPPANKPTPAERDECAPFLRRELELLDRVRVIVALGAFGYEAVWSALRAQRRARLPRCPAPAPAVRTPARRCRAARVTVLGAFHPESAEHVHRAAHTGDARRGVPARGRARLNAIAPPGGAALRSPRMASDLHLHGVWIPLITPFDAVGRGRRRGDRAPVRRVPRRRRGGHRRARHDRRVPGARCRREASRDRRVLARVRRRADAPLIVGTGTNNTRSHDRRDRRRSRDSRRSSARSSWCRTTCGRPRPRSSSTTESVADSEPGAGHRLQHPGAHGPRARRARSLLELAAHPNVAGVKQAVAALDVDTLELLAAAPAGFSVLVATTTSRSRSCVWVPRAASPRRRTSCTARFVAMIECGLAGKLEDGRHPRRGAARRWCRPRFVEPNPGGVQGRAARAGPDRDARRAYAARQRLERRDRRVPRRDRARLALSLTRASSARYGAVHEPPSRLDADRALRVDRCGSGSRSSWIIGHQDHPMGFKVVHGVIADRLDRVRPGRGWIGYRALRPARPRSRGQSPSGREIDRSGSAWRLDNVPGPMTSVAAPPALRPLRPDHPLLPAALVDPRRAVPQPAGDHRRQLDPQRRVAARCRTDLHATISQLQWMVDSYTLVFACLLLTAGSLGDRFGRSGALQLGMVIFGLGSLLSAFATAPSHLIVDPRDHGHRRRVHHAGDAVDHHQRVPARRARSRDLGAGPRSPASVSRSDRSAVVCCSSTSTGARSSS